MATPKNASSEKIHPDLEPLARSMVGVIPDQRNARLHDRQNIEAIKASLTAFGQRKPIVVRKEGMSIVAGNGTYLAASELGWTRIAMVVCDDPVEVARAYGIADNRTAELADWDNAELARTINELVEAQYDVASIGFTDEDVGALQRYLEQGEAEQKGVRDTMSNTTATNPVAEIKKHLDNDLRYVQLFYPQTVHEEVMGYLRAACTQYGVNNNSDAVLAILRERAGSDAKAVNA